MIDKVKIKIEKFTVIDDYPLWDGYRKSKYPNRHLFFRKIYNDKCKVKKPFAIRLMLVYDDLKDKSTIKINGSIRKWYFGVNNRKDLNFVEFLDCVKLLSNKIGVRQIDLWNASVTKLESGVTLLLKSKFKNVDNCFVRRKAFNKIYKDNTLYFEGANFKLKFYDKHGEINKNDKNFKNDLKKMNVNKKFHFLRFEVVVNKVSGVAFYKKNARTLDEIRNNWDELIIQIHRYINSIDFVDLISAEKEIDLTKFTKHENNKYLQFKAIQKKGFYEELKKIEMRVDKNKSRSIKSFFKDYRRYITNVEDLKTELLEELKKKTNRLYNNSNIKSISI